MEQKFHFCFSGGYPKPTTYNTDEIYIPMKIFNFDNYREIAEKARTDYGWVQKSKVFCDEAISEEKIVDDIISDDPSKSNKLVLLSEAGNGKSTIARQLITMFGDKYPDVSFSYRGVPLKFASLKFAKVRTSRNTDP